MQEQFSVCKQSQAILCYVLSSCTALPSAKGLSEQRWWHTSLGDLPNKRGPGKYPRVLTLSLLFKPLHFMLLPDTIMPGTALSFDKECRWVFLPAELSRPHRTKTTWPNQSSSLETQGPHLVLLSPLYVRGWKIKEMCALLCKELENQKGRS